MVEEKKIHIPVLLEEVIKNLNPRPNQNFIDCTLGFRGHAEEIFKKTGPKGKLLGIDLDPKAISESKKNLMRYKDRVILVNDNFLNLKNITNEYNFYSVHGILFDLGISSYQLEDKTRGFSYQKDGFLDMRFSNLSAAKKAKDILNKSKEEKLIYIFKNYGEFRESQAKKISKEIIRTRKEKEIITTKDFTNIVCKIVAAKFKKEPILSRAFQSLRIAVNDELKNLKKALPDAVDILEKGGRIACISYHSLEDRIVKHYFKREAKDCICPSNIPKCVCEHKKRLKIITKKPITPTAEEIKRNIRSRSAKLRVAEKIS